MHVPVFLVAGSLIGVTGLYFLGHTVMMVGGRFHKAIEDLWVAALLYFIFQTVSALFLWFKVPVSSAWWMSVFGLQMLAGIGFVVAMWRLKESTFEGMVWSPSPHWGRERR